MCGALGSLRVKRRMTYSVASSDAVQVAAIAPVADICVAHQQVRDVHAPVSPSVPCLDRAGACVTRESRDRRFGQPLADECDPRSRSGYAALERDHAS